MKSVFDYNNTKMFDILAMTKIFKNFEKNHDNYFDYCAKYILYSSKLQKLSCEKD